ncbi:MAG: tetratricopeptide repeat protein [Acidobacteriota bacterium]
MRVLVAYRPDDEGRIDDLGAELPPELTWHVACLAQAGHQPILAHFGRLGWRDVESFLEQEPCDLAAIFWEVANRHASPRLLRLIKKRSPQARVVATGPFAAALPSDLLGRVRALDGVVTADEAEGVLIELADVLEEGGEPVAVGGLLTRGATGEKEARLVEVGAIRLPNPLPSAGLVPSRDHRRVLVSRERGIGAERRIARREPRPLIDELLRLRQEHGLMDVELAGPGLLEDWDALGQLADELVRRKVGLAWEASLALPPLDDAPSATLRRRQQDVLRACHASGCRALWLSLRIHPLPAPVEKLVPVLSGLAELLRPCGISPALELLHGGPGETPRLVSQALPIVRALRPREGRVRALGLTPGADFDAWAEEKELPDQFWFDEDRPVVPMVSGRQLELGEQSLSTALREARRSSELGPREAELIGQGGSAWAAIDLARHRWRCGDHDEAERLLTEAAEREPWNAHPWQDLARLHRRRGRRDEEIEALRALLGRVPRQAEARARLDELTPRKKAWTRPSRG